MLGGPGLIVLLDLLPRVDRHTKNPDRLAESNVKVTVRDWILFLERMAEQSGADKRGSFLEFCAGKITVYHEKVD